jgi:pSer/pThr/pTyr-binding forkhead associated (FHA) protein
MEEDMQDKTTAPLGPDDEVSIPEEAFLILEGRNLFPLKDSMITIGRRFENTLVLNDPRVSRVHAQLRVLNGRFVLFDLKSRGGTFVNGKRVEHSLIYDGDLISLAGVELVFRQNNPPPRPDLRETVFF